MTLKLFGLVTVPGLINGDGGTDRLDYSAYGRGVLQTWLPTWPRPYSAEQTGVYLE